MRDRFWSLFGYSVNPVKNISHGNRSSGISEESPTSQPSSDGLSKSDLDKLNLADKTTSAEVLSKFAEVITDYLKEWNNIRANILTLNPKLQSNSSELLERPKAILHNLEEWVMIESVTSNMMERLKTSQGYIEKLSETLDELLKEFNKNLSTSFSTTNKNQLRLNICDTAINILQELKLMQADMLSEANYSSFIAKLGAKIVGIMEAMLEQVIEGKLPNGVFLPSVTSNLIDLLEEEADKKLFDTLMSTMRLTADFLVKTFTMLNKASEKVQEINPQLTGNLFPLNVTKSDNPPPLSSVSDVPKKGWGCVVS